VMKMSPSHIRADGQSVLVSSPFRDSCVKILVFLDVYGLCRMTKERER
jgi:hypothetical protein